MICMKCGRETQEKQVFCDGCLAIMAAYPVKPDAAIHLPARPTEDTAKKAAPRKKVIPPEEQVENLKTSNRRLILICVALTLSLGVSVSALGYRIIQQPETQKPTTGQNYTYSSEQ